MKARHALLAVLPLALTVSACDRSDPPVKKLERAAEELVTEVEGEALPRQQQGPYAPRDECIDQPGAAEFLAQMRAAITDRNADVLVSLAAQDVKLDFGGGAGHALLRERLGAEDGYLWDALDQIAVLGCATDGAQMTLPWYFAQDIPVDAFAGAIVTGENVPLRAAPNAEAEELATISWGAVEAPGGIMVESEFVAVTWTNPAGGAVVEGYLPKARLRSIVDYRLIASRRNNRWRITHFVAGD